MRIYQPLDPGVIRLLHLLPGAQDEVIRGWIEKRPLFTSRAFTEGLEYIALSYAWGSEEESGTIEIDGTELTITRNLDRCLRQLRQQEIVVTLWIDSICINQGSISEKTQQVALMPQIYSAAQGVDVWLGDESEYSSIGMDIVKYFATHPRPTKDAPWQTLPQRLSSGGLADVMSRAWFRRIWVVQEVVFAKRVRLICGTSTVSWGRSSSGVKGFMRMIKFACILPEWRHKGLDSIQMRPLLKLLDLQLEVMLAKNTGSLRKSADVLDIAYELRDRLASDPRDMLFSIAGMVDGLWSCEKFKPDYRLSVEQSYDHLQSAICFCDFDCAGPKEHLLQCHQSW